MDKHEDIVFIVCDVILTGLPLGLEKHTHFWTREAPSCSRFDYKRCIVNMKILGVDSVNEHVQFL